MVYNTTDNRSSLSITDLTSDGEYSVTVTGRDGAGRLGQESEELIVSFKQSIVVTNISYQTVSISKFYGALLSWNTACARNHAAGQINFLVRHNVTLDQSPIRLSRPSVTLYNVQPGETYAVNITLINCGLGLTKEFHFQAEVPVDLPNQMNNTVIIVKTTSTPVWVVPLIALPWLLLLIGILSVLVYIVIINVKKSKRRRRRNSGTSMHHHQKPESGVDVPQASATYYEEVGNAGRDAFTMKDNSSYAPASVSTC